MTSTYWVLAVSPSFSVASTGPVGRCPSGSPLAVSEGTASYDEGDGSALVSGASLVAEGVGSADVDAAAVTVSPGVSVGV